MTSLHYETARERQRPRPRATKSPLHPLKILAAVDGSERAGLATEYLIGLAGRGPIEVVLLNVQPEPQDWRLRGYGSFKKQEVRDRLLNDLGKPVVTVVGHRLGRAGIVHRERVELGDPAPTIVRCAEEEGCALVLVAPSRPSAFRRWLARTTGISFGSIAAELVQLADMPVVVVK